MNARTLAEAMRTQAHALRAQADAIDVAADAIDNADTQAAPAARLTVDQVAARYGCSIRHVRRRIASGKLAATRAGRGYVVSLADAEASFAPITKCKGAPANDGADDVIAERLLAAGIALGGRR
jgi:excisionase family DNA binding protein